MKGREAADTMVYTQLTIWDWPRASPHPLSCVMLHGN
jgi:hypothetical protein